MNFYTDIPIEPKEKRRILLVFLAATLLIIGIGTVLFVRYRALMDDRESVRETYDVLVQTQYIFSLLQDVETGQRGYLLTGQPSFLEPYKHASIEIDEQLNNLRQKVRDNPRRTRQLDEFATVVMQHRQLLKEQIAHRQRNLANSILTVTEAETAKAVMDHLRGLTNRMIEDEKELREQRYQAEQQQREQYARILLLCVLLALLALIVTNGVVVHSAIRRRNIELSLHRAHEFGSTIIDNSPDCIKIISTQGTLESINLGGCNLLEIEHVNDFLHRRWLDFWKGDYHHMAERAVQDALHGRTSRFEGQAPTAKGHMRWWDVTITPIFNSEGKVAQLLGISRDITDRHRAQEKLRADEARFRQLADTLPHMVWVTQPDGFHEYYNQRWYEFTGVPDGSTDGEGWNGMFHPDDQDKAWARWRHSLETGEPYEIEYRLRRHDGVYCWTLGRALPVRDEQGRITRWYGTCTVIEDQKRVESELREAKNAAEAASSAKSEFLANMSHEIRTPMNAVVGLANLLANSNLNAEKRKEFVKTIQLSAQQLMELINDLLDVAKLESHHVELEKIPFNVAELLEEIISVMGVKAREKNLELLVKYAPEMNGTFIGDPLRLRQVLMNLVSNSVKFTERGMVTLQAEPCQNEQTGEWDVCFDVIDTGIGIPASKMETVFSKFSQADTTITRKYGGTGLGLSICKTLVELMRGTIRVVSSEGLGSRFTVQIPFVRSEGAPIKLKNRKPTSGVSKKQAALPADQQPLILLVEDYKANVLVATQTIEDCGYRWELAENGEEAIAKAKSSHYDGILMDVQMPKMDGITATRHIRAWEKEQGGKRHVPILGITAYSMDGDRDKCLAAGMDDYLSKPFNPEDLKEKIRALLKGRAA